MATSAKQEAVGGSFDPEALEYLENRFPSLEADYDREGRIFARVPVEYIYSEDVPVEPEHVKELVDMMNDESEDNTRPGQQVPVWLGEVPELDQFRIIDGFHREAANKVRGEKTLYAVIKLNCNMEEIIDRRIQNAVTHRSVRFSRVINWVEASWQYSPWKDQISAARAFNIVMTNPKNPRDIDADELEKLKQWVNSKCDQWQLSAQSIYNFLTVAGIADPELVNEARERSGGRELDALTPAHLTAIAKTLPNRYDLQKLVATIAKQNNLTVTLTRGLAERFIDVEDLTEAESLVTPELLGSLRPAYSKASDAKRKGKHYRSARSVAWRDTELLQDFFVSELTIVKLALSNVILRGKYVAPPAAENCASNPGLAASQQGYALRKIGTEVYSAWDSQVRSNFVRQVESLFPNFAGQLKSGKWNFGPEEIDSTLRATKDRLISDTHTGGLRFEEINNRQLAGQMFLNVLKHEANLRKSLKTTSPNGTRNPDVLKMPVNLSVDTVINSLPNFDPTTRRALILYSIFNLSPFVAAQVLEVQKGDIEALMPQLSISLQRVIEINKKKHTTEEAERL